MHTVEVTGEDETNVLLHEVKEVVNAMKNRKAPGCDDINAELWQALGENRIKAVWQFCSVIWQSCTWPT